MQYVRVLSHLLDYPTAAICEAKDQLQAIIADAPLHPKRREQLYRFVEKRCSGDVMDWQSEYESLFERGRALSLLLFEHVHGESRDRGQAMVDLMNEYHAAGLEIGVKELPDYIPMYLEFLSTQGEKNMQLGLAEVAHILAVLACRLEQRKSDYAGILFSLLDLSDVDIDLTSVRDEIRGEKRDDTKEALDKVWEEEMVTFGPDSSNDGCGTANKPAASQSRQSEVPISWADPVKVQPETERGA